MNIKGGRVLQDANFIASTSSSSEPDAREATIQTALARAATLAVDVLEKTLDDALKIIDDIGLTTKAPTMANFDYWRNLVQKQGNALCPVARGGRLSIAFIAGRTLHRPWLTASDIGAATQSVICKRFSDPTLMLACGMSQASR